ncbi:MAG: helix-turn-helix transcriptional regulator [Panacagrimonas sp.]
MSSIQRHPVMRRLSQALALAERLDDAPPAVLHHVRAAIEACAARGSEQMGGDRVGSVGLSRRHELLAKRLLSRIDPDVVTQREVARLCGLSRSHFSRAFKQTTGLSPREWQVRSRLHRVKELLADPTRSIAEIATHCGFADQSHLTRVFAQHEAVTPARWRRAGGAAEA